MGDLGRPALRDGLVSRQVDDDFFLYDPISDRVVLLNASAVLVVELCDGTRTPDEITSELTGIFQTDRARIEQDVRATLDQLAVSGLLSRPEGEQSVS